MVGLIISKGAQATSTLGRLKPCYATVQRWPALLHPGFTKHTGAGYEDITSKIQCTSLASNTASHVDRNQVLLTWQLAKNYLQLQTVSILMYTALEIWIAINQPEHHWTTIYYYIVILSKTWDIHGLPSYTLQAKVNSLTEEIQR